MPINKEGEEVVIPPKDEEEILLEKLVFGDAEGFENNLKKLDNLYDYSDEEEIDHVEDDEDRDIDDESDVENLQDDDLFFIDDGANTNNDDMEIDNDGESEEEEDEDDEDEEDAWEDSDDERMNISLLSSDRLKKLRKTPQDSTISGKSYITRLRSQFEKIYPRPQWVDDIEEEQEEQEDEDMNDDDEDGENNSTSNTTSLLNALSKTEKFIITKQLKLLSPNKIAISRLKDANYKKLPKSGVQSISFHPQFPILSIAGFDKTIRFYQIDGKSNNFITSYFLKNCPVMTVQFSPNLNNTIFASGRRRYMNKINLNTGEVEKINRLYGHEQTQKSFEYFKISPNGKFIGLTGNNGWCNLLNGKTGQWVHGFKIEGAIIDFEFSHDESFIMIINTAGEVWEFELPDKFNNSNKSSSSNNNSKVLRKWYDDGGVGITKLKLGGKNSRWVAIGNNNGIVNIYDRNTFLNDTVRPKPIKTVENLVTSISTLQFNPDGQLLCIASRAKRDALRLVHLPTGSVYSNWPTSGTPLGKVTAVEFSPNNEMVAIGNQGGKVTLWRLDHY
ncbi:hypothetical protein G210_1910 [Candida maltosa Xu316]|uniref:U3 small nucleolar RNA-associated protein n=1 Tax=Candida maltosa (strain Xu316) TaxID=1245528 RepID=M3JZ34_CANMX|nr:hypothetical protein G210_1910 [Candida maltosa Xu316]